MIRWFKPVATDDTMPARRVEGAFSKEGLRMPAIGATGVPALATCPLGAEQCLDQYKDRARAPVWSSVDDKVLSLGFGGLTVYTC
jgi:hypothetical protein